ncbi:MAG TPA: membrane dipeptidase [Halanaerobiales bacterium]|nr:membrane dipeptidase [Halanaerobiales bacterium]
MNKKKYSGYKSYQYLEAGKDYKTFKLAKQVKRVAPYELELTEAEQKRVEKIFDENFVISAHEHPRILPEDIGELTEMNSLGREYTGYEGLSVSGMDAVFDNFLDGSCIITSKHGWKWNDILYNLGMKYCDVAHQDMYVRAENVEDIKKAKENGQVALITSLESSTMIENEVDRIDILYGFGVRCMGIVYSESNSLGTGLREKGDGGLTKFGEQAVERMNKIGMAIDVSHASDQTCLDVIEKSDYPIFINHAGARSLWDINRLKPDEVIKACAKKGGVIAVEAAPHTTITENHREHSLESVMEHFEYIVDLVGIDHVTFGPDTNFGDHVALHDEFRKFLSIDQMEKNKTPNHPKVDYVAGLDNPSENFHNIIGWFVKHGYSNDEIAKAVGGNTMRLLDEVWV